jgi:hypothetical protein
LFAEVDEVANPVLHELSYCADIATARVSSWSWMRGGSGRRRRATRSHGGGAHRPRDRGVMGACHGCR